MACWSTVEGLPSSKVTLPGASGGGMAMKPPGGTWCASPVQDDDTSPGHVGVVVRPAARSGPPAGSEAGQDRIDVGRAAFARLGDQRQVRRQGAAVAGPRRRLVRERRAGSGRPRSPGRWIASPVSESMSLTWMSAWPGTSRRGCRSGSCTSDRRTARPSGRGCGSSAGSSSGRPSRPPDRPCSRAAAGPCRTCRTGLRTTSGRRCGSLGCRRPRARGPRPGEPQRRRENARLCAASGSTLLFGDGDRVGRRRGGVGQDRRGDDSGTGSGVSKRPSSGRITRKKAK